MISCGLGRRVTRSLYPRYFNSKVLFNKSCPERDKIRLSVIRIISGKIDRGLSKFSIGPFDAAIFRILITLGFAEYFSAQRQSVG